MTLKTVVLCLLLTACGSGKDGSDGVAGAAGVAGPQGETGPAGADGAAATFKDVLFCQSTLDGIGTSIWDGVRVTYQRVRFTSGDVMVTAFLAGAGTLNESATAYYKPDQSGAEMAEITIAAGDADYLILYGYVTGEGMTVISAGTSPNVNITSSTCSLKVE